MLPDVAAVPEMESGIWIVPPLDLERFSAAAFTLANQSCPGKRAASRTPAAAIGRGRSGEGSLDCAPDWRCEYGKKHEPSYKGGHLTQTVAVDGWFGVQFSSIERLIGITEYSQLM